MQNCSAQSVYFCAQRHGAFLAARGHFFGQMQKLNINLAQTHAAFSIRRLAIFNIAQDFKQLFLAARHPQ